MIIQCDQCNTKFRLDDAKVPDRGARVRCAKCKNIFMVQKETPADEPDLDFLLSGLGSKTSAGDTEVSKSEVAASPEGVGEEALPVQAPEVPEKMADETPATPDEQHGGRNDFGEDFFSFKDEPDFSGEIGSEPGEYQFGETPADSEGTAGKAEDVTGRGESFDFGEFPFEGEDKTKQGEGTESEEGAGVTTGEFDFGTVEFGPEETSSSPVAVTTEATTEEPEPAGFAFGEETSGLPEFREKTEEKPEEAVAGEGEFVFSVAPTLEEKEGQTQVSEETAGTAEWAPAEADEMRKEEPAAATEKAETEKSPAEETATPATQVRADVKEAFVPLGASMPAAEEELPPLAITSRKKGSSFFPGVVTTVAILIVLAVAGFGFYVFREGPAAFDKLGLTFLAKWIGVESSAEGNIVVKNQKGAFLVNREAGEIFVVSGEAINNFKMPRASIQIKATILGPKGEALVQKTAYCGNILSKEQLTTLPMEKIEESMGSQFGDVLANLGVPPGKGIPFIIVFTKVPKNAGEFSVEVLGSAPAAQ